jgi:hypothetical protein
MKNAAKKEHETQADRPLRSERRLKASQAHDAIAGEYDRRGLALAMVDALNDILRHEHAGRAA